MWECNISILGLYQYDNTLFELMQLPENIDKELVTDSIIMHCEGLGVLYPDADFLKLLIGRWSEKQLPIWKRLEATLHYEYDPISNYDRTEEITDETENTKNITGENTRNISGENSGNSSQTQEDAETLDTDSDSKHKVAGYNSGSLVESEQTTSNTGYEKGFSGSITGNQSSTTSQEETGTNKQNETETHKTTHKARISGNIGVTTTQQMIDEERQSSKFNIIDYIADEFKTRFCILVY